MSAQGRGDARSCPSCRGEVAASLRACPHCGHLLAAETLKRLAADAERAEAEGRPSDALATWREALDLLPPDSRQHAAILAKVRLLSDAVAAAPQGASAGAASAGPGAAPAGSGAGKKAGALGVIGLLLWKLKAVIFVLLSKLKLIVLGLGKAKTLFSMALSFGVYWSLWGWPFALLTVLSIYVHEMGHVWALRRYGIKATVPMFIPGFGALIRVQQYPASARENAEVGLAGPLWGMASAAVLLAITHVSAHGIWGAAAHFAAWINLFNLLPVFSLDGARGFTALARRERALAAAMFGVLFFAVHDGLAFVVAAVMLWKAFDKSAPAQSDRATLIRFAVLAAGLGALLALSPQV